MQTLILDDASSGMASDLLRLRIAKEAKTLIQERQKLTDDTNDVLRALKIGKRLREIAISLGVRPAAVVAPVAAPALRTEPTGDLYPDESRKTLSQRQKDNDTAIALLVQIQAGDVVVTDEERSILAKYSGNGGGLRGADGLTGSPHEYYTPKPVAEAMWSLLGELGFAGGTVLDPSAGSGVFTATRPATAIMTQVELDQTSGAINAAINDGPMVATTVSPFESVASSTPDEIYDAVVTNVPFGDLAMRGENAAKDKRFNKRNLQEYFILRSLQKLKPNGLAAFIVPPSIVSGKGSKSVKLRLESSLMAEFVGAYRLPNKIFSESAAADTITDVIVYRKFSRATRQRIDELQQQNPAILSQANVLWAEFLDGGYFKGAGLKYVLGETVRANGRFGEVEKVMSDDSIANIAKLIHRFPASHIDWALLQSSETSPILYSDGDVIHSNGQTLQMTDGAWVPMDSQVADDRAMLDLGQKVDTPLVAVNAGVTWEQTASYIQYTMATGKYAALPGWLLAAKKAIELLGAGEMQPWYEAIAAGMAAMDLMQAADSTEPQNYKALYPVLSTQLAKCQSYGNKTIGRASRLVKDALLSIRNAYAKGKFTAFWLGEILANMPVVALTPTQLYEKVRYQSEDETGYVTVEKLRETFSDFDPLNADEWCMSSDGLSVTHASDYYSGTYAAFLARAESDLAAATDPEVRAKIVRQTDTAKSRVNTVDVSKLTFGIFTPYITPLQKLEFLRAYVSPDIFLTTDAEGRDAFDIKQAGIKNSHTEEERATYKAMQRFVKGYLRNQNITTMSKAADVADDPAREAALLRRISEITEKAKAQFDAWARANEEIQISLHNKLNAPEALRFIEEPDGTPLDIPNLNIVTFRPHSYQYGAVRRYARNFSGILGFDVGLGKTLTALAAVQYAQSIGVKKKTIFVVPNATLTNWKKEAGKAYLDTADCLFVGIVKGRDGNDKIDDAQVKRDLNMIRENRHSKIFMTLEAFKLIPLRDETMDAYVRYLTENDDAYLLAEEDALKKKANIAADAKAGRVKDVGEKSGALPYFEDMGVDSVVLDEAHNYKNSKMTSSEFKGAKYLADPTKSQRGMDMQAKAWFVRGLSSINDGVLSLTATPVTNSPLEVYSMLTLALGEREVNTMFGVTGADSFMAAACDIEEREEENIIGMMRPVRVFTGLQNAQLLRRLLQTSAIIKTAEDVKADGINISVPESEEISTSVDIGAESYARIIGYKEAYLDAVERVKAGNADPADKLTASPFNLIRKMTRVINDPELDRGVIAFKTAPSEAEALQLAIDAFNAKNITEERDYEDLNAAPADVRTKIVKDTETGETVSKFIVTVRARAVPDGVELLSIDFETQQVFLKLLSAQGIEPGVSISPKLAAMIENIKHEAAFPRHAGHAKQIIFCDELSLHHKIKIAVAQAVGIASSKIKIVNAVSVNVAGMQDVQDGFNADGEDNKYEYIVANKKAEVGINLQKGTQAIHHMTIGWTPDSVHQRNGRGVRQGNPVDSVNVYHYDADGTFDAYKRKLVGIKADWIGSLMSGDSTKIKIEGDMSSADYELLASAVGDAGAMDRINEAITLRNVRAKIATNKAAQLQSIRIVESQITWLKRYGPASDDDERLGFNAWVNSKIGGLRSTRAKIIELQGRSADAKSVLTQQRIAKQVKDLMAKFSAQVALLRGMATDADNLPVARSEYSPISDEMRESLVYTSWKKDVNVTQRMRDEAAVSFTNRADDGYSVDSLDAFQRGEAQIITGVLVAVGSFVEVENKLLVVTKGDRRLGGNVLGGFDPDTMRATDLMRMENPVFTERGSSRWPELVRRAVSLDEAAIAATPDGFNANDMRLFSTMISDVREAVTVPIPSRELDRQSFSFVRPYFPIPLVQNAFGGELIDQVKAEQDLLTGPATSNRAIVVLDMRTVGPAIPSDVATQSAVVREYCIAHKLRATGEDFASIGSRASISDVVSALYIEDFFVALPAGVAASASPEALDVWAANWFASHADWLAIPSLAAALGFSSRAYEKVRNRIDDGKERWFMVRDDVRYTITEPFVTALQAAIEGGFMVDEILNNAGLSHYVSSNMPSSFLVGGVAKTLAALMFSQNGDHLELVVGADDARASMSLSKNALLYIESWGDAVSLTLAAVSPRWGMMVSAAKKVRALRVMDDSGVDVPGMLAALRKVPGITFADVGATEVVKPADRYSALYVYRSGTYVNFGLVRGSDVFEKIAQAGAEGLQGRSFDRVAKCFRVVLENDQVFSDGKHVATVEDLFTHLGLKIADYQL